MTNDDAYDMGYTDGHQDGAREAWLIATPIIHSLRAALRAVDDEHGYGLPPDTRKMIRAALEKEGM